MLTVDLKYVLPGVVDDSAITYSKKNHSRRKEKEDVFSPPFASPSTRLSSSSIIPRQGSGAKLGLGAIVEGDEEEPEPVSLSPSTTVQPVASKPSPSTTMFTTPAPSPNPPSITSLKGTSDFAVSTDSPKASPRVSPRHSPRNSVRISGKRAASPRSKKEVAFLVRVTDAIFPLLPSPPPPSRLIGVV